MLFLKKTLLGLVALAFFAPTARAEEAAPATPKPVTFGGFIDTYYAYDFNAPTLKDRAYTTQPARHNEFNINLAYLDAKLDTDRFRGRLALQFGTSVLANYAGEPNVGLFSGANPARHLQEAVAGFRIVDRLWVDAGIYLSHIGLESFISKDNWAYTRSLMSDYSPYYQTGVRVSYQPLDQLSMQLHLLNGWQNISENNNQKALGLQVAYAPTSRFSFTYNNFVGIETGTEWRFFSDWIAKYSITDQIHLAAVYDLGLQTRPGQGASIWHVGALLARYEPFPVLAFTLRGERYMDPNQTIVPTSTPNGFQVWGASFNVDVKPHAQVMWRTEFRTLYSDDPIYPTDSGNLARLDPFIVSSISLWF
jgi:hypothetical protein